MLIKNVCDKADRVLVILSVVDPTAAASRYPDERSLDH
jgi:hypothetical protein